MSQDELFDIFNEQMERIGTDTRRNVHAKGLWHQTFHCWIVNKTPGGEERVLLQLRHKDKDTHPNSLDISCAGHLQAGETALDGLRELEEELGLTVQADELVYCGRIAEEHYLATGLIDREFHHVFVYACDKTLDEYEIQLSEISGLFFVYTSDLKQLLNGERAFIQAEGIVVDEETQGRKRESREIGLQHIVPRSEVYCKLLFEHIG
ncbi:NUDIX hydrolase [Paenibacillus thalictri]|uniref:NUDIX domain-containing protein n=1 Tax=Paenibacillus thalictri TaxID=2527873 RepID=A0A4Q9DP48_9BACL|nr:NUDIX domain-containing protein [Paenibacillus thalictri]TBL75745.1 NUDIX domain-containing protein [Paenibacillus thalictri]